MEEKRVTLSWTDAREVTDALGQSMRAAIAMGDVATRDIADAAMTVVCLAVGRSATERTPGATAALGSAMQATDGEASPQTSSGAALIDRLRADRERLERTVRTLKGIVIARDEQIIRLQSELFAERELRTRMARNAVDEIAELRQRLAGSEAVVTSADHVLVKADDLSHLLRSCGMLNPHDRQALDAVVAVHEHMAEWARRQNRSEAP